MKMAINREWHLKNRMPKSASFDERVEWHLAHEKNCSCRPMPENLESKAKKGNGKKK